MTSVGVMASSVVSGVCAAVLTENFESVAEWEPVGAVTNITGRSGLGIHMVNGASLTYKAAVAGRSATMTTGFAFRTSSIALKSILSLRGDVAVTVHLSVVLTAAGGLEVRRGLSTGTVLASSAAGLITANTWVYVELQAKLDDAAGFVTLRVNGATAASNPTCDTKNAGTATVFDSIVINNEGDFDDLYLTAGPDCPFQGDHTIP